MNKDTNTMDQKLMNYEGYLDVKFPMNKKQRLEYSDSLMTHAMLLTGVDVKKRNSTKWKIENSWGIKSGNKGYMMMTDEWFDEYTYEVVVDKNVPTITIEHIDKHKNTHHITMECGLRGKQKERFKKAMEARSVVFFEDPECMPHLVDRMEKRMKVL